MESSESALAALRRYISRPANMFDRFEAFNLLQALLRVARSEGSDKAEEYSAAFDEISARINQQLESSLVQRLFVGLLGDPVRAKMAKSATAILKHTSSSTESTFQNAGRGRPSPYYTNTQRQPVRCYRCYRWGHMARTCRVGVRGRGRSGRGF